MKKIIFTFFALSALFIITPAEAARIRSLEITSPHPYQTIRTGISIPVTFRATNVGNLNFYYKDKSTGIKQLVRENISPSSRQIAWAIPETLSGGEYDLILEDQIGRTNHIVQVKLENTSSRRTFPNANEKITITSPNGGENYLYGEPVAITWDHTGMGNKQLDILLGTPSGNGSITWTHIASGIPGNWDRYIWIPDRSSIAGYRQGQRNPSHSQFKILIVDRRNQNVKDTSDGYFSLRSSR